jgi:hypothetical protein
LVRPSEGLHNTAVIEAAPLACGADTLIVEALLDRGGEVTAVLPFETESFLRESVANGGPKWSERFDKCLKRVEVIHAT